MASSFPPEPVSTIDWSNVGFKIREGKRHSLSLVLSPSGAVISLGLLT